MKLHNLKIKEEYATAKLAIYRGDLSMNESTRRAKKKYKLKIEVMRVELYPTDEDIKQRLSDLKEPRATYIKRLIREDIKRG